MKILFIGNSFSSDLVRYMQDISNGELFVRNLYIGGCSLETHNKNIDSGEEAYEYIDAGVTLGKISIPDALAADEWDVISVQQVSSHSGIPESYEPYITNLLSYIKERCPKARLVFHKTWAYESNSDHPGFAAYGNSTERMHNAICDTVKAVTAKHGLDVIPSGDAVAAARKMPEFDFENGGQPITRDGFHMNIPYGRYLIGAVAYKFFTGRSIKDVTYVPEDADEALIKKLRALADTII